MLDKHLTAFYKLCYCDVSESQWDVYRPIGGHGPTMTANFRPSQATSQDLSLSRPITWHLENGGQTESVS